jgi:hypothetical protein
VGFCEHVQQLAGVASELMGSRGDKTDVKTPGRSEQQAMPVRSAVMGAQVMCMLS